jgi:pimeloyl-ACP methyl ester carboxylesterase
MLRRLLLGLLILLVAAVALPPLWFFVSPVPAPVLPPAGRMVEVRPGVKVNVLAEGSGRPVVLVHGHPGSAYEWVPLMRELAARGWRAIAYDRVGYGRSDGRADGDYSVAATADDLLGLLEAENLNHAVVVGWSYGGGTAIAAAHKDPSRIDRLVLIGSVGPGVENREAPPAWVDAVLRGPVMSWLVRVPPLGRAVQAAMTTAAFRPEPVDPAYLELLKANMAMPGTRETFRTEGADLDGRANVDPAAIDRPILVIHGEQDQLVPVAVGRTLADHARGGQLWEVPDAGHMLPITRPAPLAERIAEFAGPQ